MSRFYHPDKCRPDPSKNLTIEFINDRWVEMTKAHKALTDDEIRNNYLMYGNPDGKQSTSIGIALPTWMVEEGNRWIVVAFYGIVLGIILPYTLAKWWYGTQALTKDKILHASAGSIFKEWKEDIAEDGVLGALSVAEEYKETLTERKGDSGAAKVEGKVLKSSLLPVAAVEKLKSVDDPIRRKTLALLWAYLGRIELDDPELEREKYAVAVTAFQMNNAFTSISLPFNVLGPLLASFKTSQYLIQALTPGSPPALQLPHFTRELIKKISGGSSKSSLSVQRLMALPPKIRRNLCSDLSDVQYNQAMKVASQMPHLQVAKAFFKVVGDRVVTPGSLVQLVIKARIIPPGTENVPEVNPQDLEDIDPEEGDLDAIRRERSGNDKTSKPVDDKEASDNDEEAGQPSLAYAPYFAADHAPRWHVFLADSRAGRIAVPPFTFTAFNKRIFNDDGTPTFNVLTLKCPFQAPPQVAGFPFTMHIICDSYVGMDSRGEILLDVRDVSEANVVESEEEISEPDEGMFRSNLLSPKVIDTNHSNADSLAGQLQAMKTGGAPPKKKVKKTIQQAREESDDESDTEGEVEDTSETDTETEDES